MAIFDRFIAYAWTERALEMAMLKESPFVMKSWLIEQGLGSESARRTNNLLMRLWFKTGLDSEELQNDAFSFFRSLNLSEHLVLHWGMAIHQFPVFRETAQVIGRLGFLQGEFTKEEIINRVLTKYSNQSTIRRGIERIIQTMTDWSVIQITPQHNYHLVKACSISSPGLAAWFFRTIMLSFPDRYWLVPDLLGAMESFPFDTKHHTAVLYSSPYFDIIRDASGAETIGLRNR